MSQRNNSGGFLRSLATGALLCMLAILIWQQNEREKKLIVLYKDHQALMAQIARTDQKIAGISDRLNSGIQMSIAGASRVSVSEHKYLHPEMPNALKGLPPEPAPLNANSNGILHKVYAFQGTDPKGMNFIIENSAGLSEDIQGYVGQYLGGRSPSNPEDFYPQ